MLTKGGRKETIYEWKKGHKGRKTARRNVGAFMWIHDQTERIGRPCAARQAKLPGSRCQPLKLPE